MMTSQPALIRIRKLPVLVFRSQLRPLKIQPLILRPKAMCLFLVPIIVTTAILALNRKLKMLATNNQLPNGIPC